MGLCIPPAGREYKSPESEITSRYAGSASRSALQTGEPSGLALARAAFLVTEKRQGTGKRTIPDDILFK